MSRITVLVCLCAVCLLVTACAQPTATPTISSTTMPQSVSGTITFAGQPLPEARAELYAPGWRENGSAAVAFAVADAEGRFIIDAPVGEYSLVGIFPDGEKDTGGWPPITLAAGQAITDIHLELQRSLTLLEPAMEAEVEATPTLRWEPFAKTVQYRLWVLDAGTTELIINEVVSETAYAISKPLSAGRTYEWLVTAIGENEVQLADGTGIFHVAE